MAPSSRGSQISTRGRGEDSIRSIKHRLRGKNPTFALPLKRQEFHTFGLSSESCPSLCSARVTSSPALAVLADSPAGSLIGTSPCRHLPRKDRQQNKQMRAPSRCPSYTASNRGRERPQNKHFLLRHQLGESVYPDIAPGQGFWSIIFPSTPALMTGPPEPSLP